MIQKGFIEKVLEGGLRAQVKAFQGEILPDVLLLHPNGEASNPEVNESSNVLLFFALGSKTASFGIPYNPPQQPTLEPGEKAVGNFSVGNKITFKANGDIEVIATNDLIETVVNKTVTATTNITLSAPVVNLGDAVGLVLNDAAAMEVVIASGSSAGTYPVSITAAGQTKVSA